jgi:hypothetical protein
MYDINLLKNINEVLWIVNLAYLWPMFNPKVKLKPMIV